MCNNYYPTKKKGRFEIGESMISRCQATKLIYDGYCAIAPPTTSLLYWNCRELVNSRENHNLHEMVRESSPSILFLFFFSFCIIFFINGNKDEISENCAS